MKNYREILLNQYKLRTNMTIQDMVKLIFQSEFGGGHLISNEDESLGFLKYEINGIIKGSNDEDKVFLDDESIDLFEYIGNKLYRLNLVPALERGLSPTTINKFFVHSANTVKGSPEQFEAKLDMFLALCHQDLLPYDLQEVKDYLNEYKIEGYKPVSHTDSYRTLYKPAYRIVSENFKIYYEVFSNIDRLMSRGDGGLTNINDTILLAIDGMSASGKTSLSQLLDNIYDCNIFHMDDFFLPPELKTKERMLEVGGNVDYERFNNEVISGLNSENQFTYKKYNCQTDSLSEKIHVTPKKLNIIEGAYSMHNTLIENYDLKVYLSIDPKTQSERILNRNGKAMHNKFMELWIPLENEYFRKYDIKKLSDIVIWFPPSPSYYK